MLRLLTRWRETGRGGSAALAALCFLVFFDTIFLKMSFQSRVGLFGQRTALAGLLIDGAYIFVPVYYSLLAASYNRLIFRTYVILLFVCSAVPAYFACLFKTNMNVMAVAALRTNRNEALGFVDWQFLAALAVFLLIGVGISAAGRSWLRISVAHFRSIGALRFLVPLVLFELAAVANRSVAHVSLAEAAQNYLPYAFFSQSIDTIEQAKVVRERMKKKKDVGVSYKSSDAPVDDLVVAVVVGEAARSRNFSLNGYPRETNPRLGKIPNLVSFGSAYSCQNLTHLAVPCLMTRSTTADIDATLGRETSFISVFNHLGYHSAWLTTEPDWSYVDSGYDTVTQIALETREQRFSWMVNKENLKASRQKESFADEVLLQDFDRLLAQHRKLLVVFNTFGSHYPYQRDYIRGEFARFQPSCATVQDCDDFDHLENAYDNTIVYTDYFLSEIIRRLKGRRALFLYVSDHGESIAEDKFGHRIGRKGVFSHGQGSDRFVEMIKEGTFDEQRRVPMLWWASDSFLADTAGKRHFGNLKRKLRDVVSQDNVFHSIIDCAGISSDAVDGRLSLCGPEPVPRYDALLGQKLRP